MFPKKKGGKNKKTTMGSKESTNAIPASPERYESNAKKAVRAIGMAAIERLGKKSPASVIASDTFVLKEIAELLRPSVSYIFTCGGYDGHDRHNRCAEILDISENKWRRLADVPGDGLQDHEVAFAAGRVFVIGGGTFGGEARAIVRSIDVTRPTMWGEEEWTEVPNMSEARSCPGVGVVGDRIFVISGKSNYDSYLNSCEAFNVAKWGWEPVAPIPTKRWDFGVAVIDEKIFAIGGHNGDTLADFEMLDTRADTWTKLPRMPSRRNGVAAAVVDDRFIWVFGSIPSIDVFDVEKSEWKTITDLHEAFVSARAVAVGHKIFMIGGTRVAGGTTSKVDILDTDTMKWETAAPMSVQRAWFSAVGF